jgi:hypothetical protein
MTKIAEKIISIVPKDYTCTYPDGKGLKPLIEKNPDYIKPLFEVRDYLYLIVWGRNGHEDYYGYDYPILNDEEYRRSILKYFIEKENILGKSLWCKFGIIRKTYMTLFGETKEINRKINWESKHYFFDNIPSDETIDLKVMKLPEILKTPGSNLFKLSEKDKGERLVYLHGGKISEMWPIKERITIYKVSDL